MASTTAMAQRPGIEFTLEGNYLWTSSIDATFYDQAGRPQTGTFDIRNNPALGFAVDVEIRPGTQLEFFYLNQASSLQFRRAGTGVWEDRGDVSVSYYQIGGLQGIRHGKVLPFGGLTLGASSFNPESGGETQWKFAMGLNAGAKVYLNDRIGLRFHGRALISFLDTGAGLWVGTGGVSFGFSGYGIWQWDLGLGLVILL
jgi:hypothetical protein